MVTLVGPWKIERDLRVNASNFQYSEKMMKSEFLTKMRYLQIMFLWCFQYAYMHFQASGIRFSSPTNNLMKCGNNFEIIIAIIKIIKIILKI